MHFFHPVQLQEKLAGAKHVIKQTKLLQCRHIAASASLELSLSGTLNIGRLAGNVFARFMTAQTLPAVN